MRLPRVVVRAFKKSRRGPAELDKIGPAVSGQIEELQSAARDPLQGRSRGHDFERREFGHVTSGAVLLNYRNRAEIAFVKPGAGLFGKDARHAVSVQIYPLIIHAVQARRQIIEASRA